jgi:hypothetical protein
VRTKDLCWSVGMIYGSREMPGVSTTGPDSVELNARLPCAAARARLSYDVDKYTYSRSKMHVGIGKNWQGLARKANAQAFEVF